MSVMDGIVNVISDMVSSAAVAIKTPRLDVIFAFLGFLGLAFLAIGLLVTPDANRIAGLVFAALALAVLWGVVRALRRPKNSSD
jgi:membrane protein implicated in regulation of membrane protease activity